MNEAQALALEVFMQLEAQDDMTEGVGIFDDI